ncbi:hypothetical protein Tco_1430500, partial [Tanacetum coccineum]
MAMTAEENPESESDTEEPPFEKITFNTDYMINTSLEVPHTDLELKHLPYNLEYAFLEEPSFLSLIISSQLPEQDKIKLIYVLIRHKQAFAWKTTDILGISIFHDMIKESIEVFMDNFSIFGNSFDNYLRNFDKMLQHCKDANIFLNWEKCHFMVKEEIVLGHKVSGDGLEVDKAKINIENDETIDDSDVDNNFPEETLMEITTNDTPTVSQLCNYLWVMVYLKGMRNEQKNKFCANRLTSKTTLGKTLTFSMDIQM